MEEEKSSPLKMANRSFVQNVSIVNQTQDFNRTASPKKTSPSPKPTQKKENKIEFEEQKVIELTEQEKLEVKYGRYWLFDVLMDDAKK